MQKYFIDSTDTGKLYINYPMVESYWDTYDKPEESFEYRRKNLPMNKGIEYKNAVNNTKIALAVEFPGFLDDVLEKEFGINDEKNRMNCVSRILCLNSHEKLKEEIDIILKGKTSERNIMTAKHFLQDKMLKIGYLQEGSTYYEFMQKVLCRIICMSIRKANMVQGGDYGLMLEQMKDVFADLDFVKIAEQQCECSNDAQQGFIWVLNTSVFFVPDYSFSFITLS